MDTALKLATSYAAASAPQVEEGSSAAGRSKSKGPEVINLMSVGGSQQVMLEVKVAEMQRNLFKNLNVRFNALDFGSSSRWSSGGFNNGAGLGFNEDGNLDPTTLFGDGKGIFGQFLSDEFLFNVVLEASKDNGTAKVLAEPTLTTLTGQQAEFISGGEFPVPITEDDGITIEYKEFGVGVKFLPVVLDSGRINLNLNVSVSELSNTNALVLDTGLESVLGDGVAQVIPSLTKRSAQSTVELRDSQTIAIARPDQREQPRLRQPLPRAGRPAGARHAVSQPAVHQWRNRTGDPGYPASGHAGRCQGGAPADRRLRAAERPGVLPARQDQGQPAGPHRAGQPGRQRRPLRPRSALDGETP